MGVLSVAVALDQGQIQMERVWQFAGGGWWCRGPLRHQIGGDCSVVGGGVLEGLDGQPAAQLCVHPP